MSTDLLSLDVGAPVMCLAEGAGRRYGWLGVLVTKPRRGHRLHVRRGADDRVTWWMPHGVRNGIAMRAVSADWPEPPARLERSGDLWMTLREHSEGIWGVRLEFASSLAHDAQPGDVVCAEGGMNGALRHGVFKVILLDEARWLLPTQPVTSGDPGRDVDVNFVDPTPSDIYPLDGASDWRVKGVLVATTASRVL